MTPRDRWIRFPDAAAAPEELGGKALGLRELDDLGVPAWFVVTPAAQSAAGDPHEAAALETEVRAAANRIAPDGDAFAVRSSAVCEDGAEHSFAGQFESLLRVPTDQLLPAIRQVWDSAGGERVDAYRRERGAGDGAVVMPVLVQRMVDARCAGVAFAVDPITGDDVVVVSAVPGTAESLVAGAEAGETARVDPDGGVVFDTETRGVLDEALAGRIAALVRAASRRRGGPQDVEWAFDGVALHLLQARAVTGAPTGELAIWDNSNIAESYAGVTTALTFSFARRAYEEVYRTFCLLLGVDREVVDAHGHVFRRMLGLLEGRVYYELLSWYRLVSLLPGYAVNARFMEQMMGVRSGLPHDAVRQLRIETARRGGGGPRAVLRLVRSTAMLAVRRALLGRSIRRFRARLDRHLAASEGDDERRSPHELVAIYRDLETALLRRWDAPILNDFSAMVSSGALRALCIRLDRDTGAALHAGLLLDIGDVVSTEPARRIEAMAELARDEPRALDALDRGDREALAAYPKLDAAVRAYVERFGDRCLGELKLESPTLRHDPAPLLRSIATLARRPAGRSSGPPSDAPARLRTLLRGRPLASIAVRWLLPSARARLRDRENLRFERTRVFGRVRRLFLALGARYADAGLLDDPRDVFHLEVEEALGLAVGTATTPDVRALVALRRAAYDTQRAAPPPPDRFETRGAVHPLRPILRPSPAAPGPDADGVLRGTACSPGRVRGAARVVRDPLTARLEPGEILVAERTDPGWVVLFPAAAGIAVEHGSVLSHTSIVARELAIPCVVGVAGLLAAVQSGDLVELDAHAGTLRLVHEP